MKTYQRRTVLESHAESSITNSDLPDLKPSPRERCISGPIEIPLPETCLGRVLDVVGKLAVIRIAPLDDETENWITRIWDEAEVALRHACRQDIEAARPWIDKVSSLTQELFS
jgi:hypothetical protein